MMRGSQRSIWTIRQPFPGFSSGEGGIEVNGTWLIGDLDAQSKEAGNALSDGYTVYPVPQFYPAKDATYVDGHGWAVPRGDRDDEKMAAIGKLFKFLETNDFEWARTGHLPAVKAVFDMPQFKALPHRDNIEKISKIGQTLPDGVMRQFALQDIVGEELAAAINGNKSVDDALARIEKNASMICWVTYNPPAIRSGGSDEAMKRRAALLPPF